MRATSDLTVVKLGGSYALSPNLRDWLAAIARGAGSVVLVPGGGPFADAVRAAQPRMGFDDRAAHRMALLAMEQYAFALAALDARLMPAASLVGIRRALRAGYVPIWLPCRMAAAAPDLAASWDVTSDSLSAWLAARLRARRLMLVKQVRRDGTVRADELAADGVIDPALSGILRGSGVEAVILGHDDCSAAGEALARRGAVGGRVALH